MHRRRRKDEMIMTQTMVARWQEWIEKGKNKNVVGLVFRRVLKKFGLKLLICGVSPPLFSSLGCYTLVEYRF